MEKIKALLYCCKQPHKLFYTDKGFVLSDFELGDAFKDKTLLNGKIVAECDFEVDGTGCIDPLEYLKTYKFCLNCGADMREPFTIPTEIIESVIGYDD